MLQDRCVAQDLIAAASDAFLILKQHDLRVVTAESCTAGLIAACLSQAESAADLLEGSFVTYTKAQKTKALGIAPELLAERSAVHGEVACAMARGALTHSQADIALAVTGVLGPSRDEDGNPVGLVYMSCLRRGGRPAVRRYDYGAQPHDVLRNRVVCDALGLLKDCAR